MEEQVVVNRIKIKNEGGCHKIFIGDEEVSMSVRRINVSLDPNDYGGRYAIVDM